MRENEGSVIVAASLISGILARDVIVSLKTVNGTAMGKSTELLQEFHIHLGTFSLSLNAAGIDFPNTSLNLTFSPSSTTQTVIVSILNDAVTEDMLEYFSLVLMSTDPAVSLNPMIANITITDDNDSKYYQMSAANMFVCIDLYCILWVKMFSSHLQWLQLDLTQ